MPGKTPRDQFRESVFERDHHQCVLCKGEGVDAHHIIERRLWSDGGYLIDNGATLCGPCHLRAEMTLVSCEEIRKAAGVTKVCVPHHLCSQAVYDKWGNEILPNGTRLRGELFEDESVQKLLVQANLLPLFTPKIKYPRTPHLPWSPGLSDPNEHVIEDLSTLAKSEIVVTAKMDGENTTLYRDELHARSLDYSSHPSRNRLKAFWDSIRFDIPDGWRICVENLYATHSIHYTNLPSWWLGLSIWDHNNCLSWDDTLEYFGVLGIRTCQELYRGPFKEGLLKSLYSPTLNGNPLEGYVVRAVRSFHYKEFRHCVAKYVRPNHNQTNHGFMTKQVVPNELKIA